MKLRFKKLKQKEMVRAKLKVRNLSTVERSLKLKKYVHDSLVSNSPFIGTLHSVSYGLVRNVYLKILYECYHFF